jgi:hypothetical protein
MHINSARAQAGRNAIGDDGPAQKLFLFRRQFMAIRREGVAECVARSSACRVHVASAAR